MIEGVNCEFLFSYCLSKPSKTTEYEVLLVMIGACIKPMIAKKDFVSTKKSFCPIKCRSLLSLLGIEIVSKNDRRLSFVVRQCACSIISH